MMLTQKFKNFNLIIVLYHLFVIRTQWAGFKIADFPIDILEKRPSRFSGRWLQTPEDIFDLYKALKSK